MRVLRSIGLDHGGGDGINDKPNYLSVMNYTFRFKGLPHINGTKTLDNSRFALPNRDEANLDEASSSHGGSNTFRLRSHGLRPGRYHLRARPAQTGATPSTVSFRITLPSAPEAVQ
ncbi:MAG TPA: hypothetical protein VFH80_21710 [Solirubrobacteraceae bacterium]|nr:hypothetical protein [Solirubrobacteraceae bacterium]